MKQKLNVLIVILKRYFINLLVATPFEHELKLETPFFGLIALQSAYFSLTHKSSKRELFYKQQVIRISL
jgi:hypothetical protein